MQIKSQDIRAKNQDKKGKKSVPGHIINITLYKTIFSGCFLESWLHLDSWLLNLGS